jgi:hypothetical protein
VDSGTGSPGPDGPREVDERTIVQLVRGLAPLTAPDARARDRMRERILAGLPTTSTGHTTMVAERHTAPGRRRRLPRTRPAGADRGTARPGDPPRAGTGARARFAIAAVALLALVLSLTGMSLLLARDALPGDTLYGIKRTAEAASLGLTFGDEPKALKHLEFAASRVTEIETLAQRYANPADAPVGGYLTALSDFDNDAAAGSRQLIALATRNDGRQLESLRDWAKQQNTRLAAVAVRLPGSARSREGASLDLLAKIAGRADALLARMQCYQITTGSFDDIGALPATGACERIPGAPAPAQTAPGAGNTRQQPVPDQTLTTPPGAPPAQTPAPGQAAPSGAPGALPGILPTTSTPSGSTGTQSPAITVPLPLPTIQLPPLVPGLPGVRIGG